jgi:hypothetical protein
MKSVQDAVAALKVRGGQVTTTGLYLSPDYVYANNQQTMRGFVGRHTITIQVDDVSRAGEVLAAVVTAGATNVNGIAFSRRDRQTLEQQALKQAVQRPRAGRCSPPPGAGLFGSSGSRRAGRPSGADARGGAAALESINVSAPRGRRGQCEPASLTATIK